MGSVVEIPSVPLGPGLRVLSREKREIFFRARPWDSD